MAFRNNFEHKEAGIPANESLQGARNELKVDFKFAWE